MQSEFIGFFDLDETLDAPVNITGGTGAPSDPSVAPNFRVYNGSALMNSGTGNLSKLDTGAVTNATNATPIVVTSVAHGLKTGNRATLSGVGGNTAANGDWPVTRVTDDTFSLDGSAGSAPYTSGGTWHVTGLYQLEISLASGDGYEVGETYFAVVTWIVSAVTYAKTISFMVS